MEKRENAVALKEFMSSSDDLPTPLQEFYQNGIFVGCSKLVRLSERQKLDICHWVQQQHPTINREEFGELAQQYTRLVKTDRLHQATIYREGDCVILLGSEWVLKSILLLFMDQYLWRTMCLLMDSTM